MRYASLSLLGLTVVASCSLMRPARVATSLAAHTICSQTFVAGRLPNTIYNDYVSHIDGIDVVSGLMRYKVDDNQQQVAVSLAGTATSRAVHTQGRGCTVLNSGELPARLPHLARPYANDPFDAPNTVIRAEDARLAAAIDQAFSEPEQGPQQHVQAIVIVYRGQIIAERYAKDVGPETPMLSWSIAKSVTNAMIGILVRERRVSPADPAPVAAWSSPDDPRHKITIDQLLRQTSGQPFGSANNGFDRATNMLFLEPDTAAVAANTRFPHHPGEVWSYTDGNYAILSGVIRDMVGGDAQSVAKFAHDELFAPLGMRSVVLEFDEAGSPMGAAFMLASARDWARFGYLFLNDGVTADGRKVLPDGWVDYSRSPTLQSDLGYGAGFWTNSGDSRGARVRRSWGAPVDSFFANGNFGQTILIIPSEDLVIARFGFSQDDGRLNMQRTTELAASIIEILQD